MHNLYDDSQTDAAAALIELILPDADSLDEAFVAFQDTLDDWDNEDAPVTAAVVRALAGEAAFSAARNHPEGVIGALDALAERWGAGLMYGSNDPDGEFTHHNTAEALLKAAAGELADYGLTLWLYAGDEEQLQGFIAREDDDDLIEKISEETDGALSRAAELPAGEGG